MSLKQSIYYITVDSNMVGMTAGLYLAGTDSTAQTLYCIFLYLVLYPDIQEKIHTEIIQHLGRPTIFNSNSIMFEYCVASAPSIAINAPPHESSILNPQTGFSNFTEFIP